MLSLSKSDFILAQSCPTKLYYRENNYPESADSDFNRYLAEGGYLIGKYAQIMYPGGIEIGNDNSIAETARLIEENENIILFEAAIVHGSSMFRIDILIKSGQQLKVIEVKSKSWNSVKDKHFKASEIKYRDDALFQAIKLKDAYPDYEIKVSLLLPDKAKNTELDHLHKYFNVRKLDTTNSAFHRHNIEPNFEPGSEIHHALIKDSVLVELSLDDELEKNEPEIRQSIEAFEKLYSGNSIRKIEGILDKKCNNCEFKVENEKSGFSECWGSLANSDPHLFDLYFCGSLGNDNLNKLITSGKTGLFDVRAEMLRKKDGTFGARAKRQEIQIKYTAKNKEWISPELPSVLRALKFPLFFIDFESATSALPPFKGMHPYEPLAFQWSCHIVRNFEDPPEHFEYISQNPEFPNFEFAETLCDMVGENQNLLMWATHENTILKVILEQIIKYNYKNRALSNWLKKAVKMNSEDSGFFTDMNELTLKYYFHPMMKGRTSIKKTMPAIWFNNSYLHSHEWFKEYTQSKGSDVLNPYEMLAFKNKDFHDFEAVQEGTGAMRAYFEMNFGQGAANQRIRDELAKSLLNYCKLDTLSMVIVWYHWIRQCGLIKY